MEEGVSAMIKRIGWVGGLLFLVWGVAFAQRTWEGTATVARYGEFPPGGMYGTSNSFERNSIVDVENLSNGKRARIIITGRVSDPTQFLVVSEQVAAELGIGKFDVTRVRVSPVVTPGVDPSLVKPELPLSPDPDINPSARVSESPTTTVRKPEAHTAPGLSIIPAAPLSPTLSPGPSPAPEAPVTPPIAPTPSIEPSTVEEPVPPAPSMVSPPPVAPGAPVAASTEGNWKEPDLANPYTGLEASLLKRDKAAFSGLSLVLEAESQEGGPEVPSTVSNAPSGDSRQVEAKGTEAPRGAELPLETVKPESKETALKADLPASEEIAMKAPEGKEAPQEITTEGETQIELQLALDPTGPKPPLREEKFTPTTTGGTDTISKLSFPIQEAGALERGFYYLQIGMFAKPQSVQTLWERFHRDYPLVVLKEEVGLRVLVGPLKRDERGVLYQTFKALGLKDTFFVKID